MKVCELTLKVILYLCQRMYSTECAGFKKLPKLVHKNFLLNEQSWKIIVFQIMCVCVCICVCVKEIGLVECRRHLPCSWLSFPSGMPT